MDVYAQAPPRASAENRRVGRFSEGIEDLPATPSKLHVGRFSEGIERRRTAPDMLRTGRFSEGIERLPRNTPSKRRRGTFGTGYAAVR